MGVLQCGYLATSHVHMFYQKAKNAPELFMDPITVGNWTRNMQGVLRFIEVGGGGGGGGILKVQ